MAVGSEALTNWMWKSKAKGLERVKPKPTSSSAVASIPNTDTEHEEGVNGI